MSGIEIVLSLAVALEALICLLLIRGVAWADTRLKILETHLATAIKENDHS